MVYQHTLRIKQLPVYVLEVVYLILLNLDPTYINNSNLDTSKN